MSSRRIQIALLAGFMLCAAYLATHFFRLVPEQPFSRPASDRDVIPRIDPAEYARIAAGGEHYGALRYVLDFQGVINPQWKSVDAAPLGLAQEVIGVTIDDQAYAFALDSMLNPTDHVVNASAGGKSISAAYCDKTQCIRVFTSESPDPIPLHVGGLTKDDRMVLMLDEERYDQDSENVPLQDHPFVRTTFGEWKSLHPDTKVFCSEGDSTSEAP